MKKWITVTLLIIIGLGGIFILRIPQPVATPFNKIIFEDKLFGQPAELVSWITPDAISVQRVAKDLKQDTDEETIRAVYAWMENDYHYVMDTSITFLNGKISVYAVNSDYWQMPVLSLAIMSQNNGFYGDCEDGSFLMLSILRACGVENVWCEIGTVSLNSGVYGHAWLIWEQGFGKKYLIETTLGSPELRLKNIPSFYSPSYKFNEEKVYKFIGGITGEISPLDQNAISELKEMLNEKNKEG